MGKYYYTVIIYWQNFITIKTSFSFYNSCYQKSFSTHRQKHMQFDDNDEISTLLNMVLSLVLNLSEIQIETTLQILFLCSASLGLPMGKKFHTIFCI